ncbi:hypothetical protein A2673_00770 [Candidatus Kaiserbacteria bacterium RIFCSPHIGHO2_01_FULL_50_13]|uniref:RNHCP domain-containing protein n=1 Tax=Candidatus Kaiserbacteria bacterium RIFCSPLOWO2_01_FULL_50_24 TaxID=1798507 RepID=A0A1F6EMX3_9BACT|nr:MAG: hypothetical protein A2673_00770 [Candidatus Kaiserbacteria bacterium RIFCSPHIGHO2_01_FULL_50_13]OGG74987.1 MAG: hypothetical protein A3A34_04195 [Candidatus Kaiserbacteria bacterium RIFCSPLOWO2_01_FULL_50_24]OGG81790.1 MAG: hypothetical protein A3H74_01270 [Candidatus Kaiserbacteria bacterium RIFCSPLOWO2_02_FULL_51_13]
MVFIKQVEDFACDRCGLDVKGNGYTNHCPRCLWSKHVDNEPGDRANKCGGLMEPTRVEGSSPTYRIIHRCTTCGAKRPTRQMSEDNVQALCFLASCRA